MLGQPLRAEREVWQHAKPEPGSSELGRVHEAHNVLTDNPALVLIPSERASMEPQEEWQVRLRSQSAPPCVALEVEKAPASGRLSQVRGVLELLGTAIERLGNGEEARAHLTCLPRGPLESLRYPNKGEVEINGGCWVELARRPPCYGKQAEYRGKCYLPVSARSRDTREPRSLHR